VAQETNKEVSLCLVTQKIEYELAGIGIVYWEDLWGDILELITTSPMGWQDVQVAWQNTKSSGVIPSFVISELLSDFLVQVPPLLDDIRAWRLFQAWAYGHVNPTLVTDAMEVVFGEQYIQEEWEDEDEDSLPQTCGVSLEILRCRGLSLPLLEGGDISC